MSQFVAFKTTAVGGINLHGFFPLSRLYGVGSARFLRVNFLVRFCSLTAMWTARPSSLGASLSTFLAIELSNNPSIKMSMSCCWIKGWVNGSLGQACSAMPIATAPRRSAHSLWTFDGWCVAPVSRVESRLFHQIGPSVL